MAPLQIMGTAINSRELKEVASSVLLDIVKRQSGDGNNGLPTVAIVLLAILAVLLSFGVVAIIMHSKQRSATMPGA